MKKELLGKTIVQLESIISNLQNTKTLLDINISKLKEEKNGLNNEMVIIKEGIDNGDNRNIEYTEINKELIKTNESLRKENSCFDKQIALLHIKKQGILDNIAKQTENLNEASVSVDNINNDIFHLSKDKASLENMNIAIIQDNINKRKEKDKINKNITKSSNILSDINNKIDTFKKREEKLSTKQLNLIKKENRLVLKELRLNNLKKELLSKK